MTSVKSCILGLSLLMTATAVCAQESSDATITIDATGSGKPIARQIMGANNVWYEVPETDFQSYAQLLIGSAGVTYMRFPGGFESEWYYDSSNTLDPSYKNYTSTPGAKASDVLSNFGNNNVSYVVPTRVPLDTATVSAYQQGATAAAQIVSKYAGQIQDFQVGNEWYNFSGASSNYTTFLKNYATLLQYYVPAMRAAAGSHPIRIFVTANFSSVGDMSSFPGYVGSTVWNQIDGLDLHIYTGINPGTGGNYPTVGLKDVATTIEQFRSMSNYEGSGTKLIYVSEWSADRNDNNDYGGLQDANIMIRLFSQLAQARVDLAAYWPPVLTAPQNNTVTLLGNLSQTQSAYTVAADGQLFNSLSANFQGNILPNATVVNSNPESTDGVTAIAAENNGALQIFIMSGPSITTPQQEHIVVNGFNWSTIKNATVFYVPDGSQTLSVSSGPAMTGNITSQVTITGSGSSQQANFTIDPGNSSTRGSSWEIVRLVLQ